MALNRCNIKKLRKKLLIAFFFITSISSSACANLADRIDGIIGQKSQSKVRFGIQIIRADTQQVIYSRNPEKAMIPASNMKLIVTAVVLNTLGPKYEYKTQVGFCGNTLVVIGSGDPLLGDKDTDAKKGQKAGWVIEDIAARLRNSGITTIMDIVVDSSIFDDERIHPNWSKNQLNRDYACEVSGLNFNGNCVDMTVKVIDGRAKVFIEPENTCLKFTNEVRVITRGSGAVGAYRRPGKPNQVIVKGAAFFGFLLYENLIKAGVKVEGHLIEKAAGPDCDYKPLAEYKTPITDCLARANKNSFGLAADALLKTISAHADSNKNNGSWEGGRRVITKYLISLGIPENEFYIDDGRGLSRENKLSANAVTKVLLAVYKSSDRQVYKDSLAVGGVDGTVDKYFKEPQFRDKIFGKTGYIAGVKSFSGVCTSGSGEYIFSILANNANSRTRLAINDIVKAIILDGE
jgi:D-alanyl-D-alanine carboxypeptidase/D-alanyl-D-alanine-endopeptidase (penicillin-binding protein 4)